MPHLDGSDRPPRQCTGLLARAGRGSVAGLSLAALVATLTLGAPSTAAEPTTGPTAEGTNASTTSSPAAPEPTPAESTSTTDPAPASPQGAPPASPAGVPTPAAQQADEPTDEPAEEPTEAPTGQPDEEPAPEPAPEKFVPLKKGERSDRVRVLESRLHQLGLHPEVVTSLFDEETRRAVVAFKKQQKLPGAKGVVDERAWKRLVSLTREPTPDELTNVFKSGKPLLRKGDRSPKVRDLEARLGQLRHFTGRVDQLYDRRTLKAVRKFQKAERIPVTGAVDARTLERLHARTRRPTKAELRNWQFDLDARCLTGKVLCIDKTTRSLKWVVDGQVTMRLDARFGDPVYPTREGTFQVFKKSRDHVSSIYGSPMPFAMFFSGGQAVHYSEDFKRNGYNGHSHGCVNIRNLKAITKLFDHHVKIGTKVVVFRS